MNLLLKIGSAPDVNVCVKLKQSGARHGAITSIVCVLSSNVRRGLLGLAHARMCVLESEGNGSFYGIKGMK